MRIEVRCTSCGKSFLVDSGAIAGGLACPGCSAPMQRLDKPAAAPATPPTAQPAAPGPSAATDRISPPVTAESPAPAHAAAQAAELPAGAEEVVCPRCQLHFVPRRAGAQAKDSSRRTVLVVEDMDFFREIARDALASRYEVKTATNVQEARAALTAGGIDLMVLDLTLDGGEHGVELLRTMTAKPCPIVIYTAKDESEMYGDSWDELLRLGADDLVMKGMNVGESLVRKVAALFGEDLNGED
jgi:CheY-like chemotaxis protein/DNA-directed RNA polymerase subunit RPC12/RpoP